MHVYMWTYMHIYIYIHIHICIYVYICMYSNMHACLHRYIDTWIMSVSRPIKREQACVALCTLWRRCWDQHLLQSCPEKHFAQTLSADTSDLPQPAANGGHDAVGGHRSERAVAPRHPQRGPFEHHTDWLCARADLPAGAARQHRCRGDGVCR